MRLRGRGYEPRFDMIQACTWRMAVTLQVQGRAEDDRVWSFEHLRGLIELFLQLGVTYDLRRLAHLANQLLESAEDTDETAFELIGEL